MQAFASNCSTVANPTYFAISSTKDNGPEVTVNEKKETQLNLRNAIHEKLPVVSCVSPLFFNERWQTNMFSIEIYAYFGVHRQAYYYMSVLEDGFNLLKVSKIE
uniref:Glycosyltransferase family 92 protein n=1 Tax=Panagrolaimus superbus TaxID=310955 RepID=A0A914Y3R0_9BILA